MWTHFWTYRDPKMANRNIFNMWMCGTLSIVGTGMWFKYQSDNANLTLEEKYEKFGGDKSQLVEERVRKAALIKHIKNSMNSQKSQETPDDEGKRWRQSISLGSCPVKSQWIHWIFMGQSCIAKAYMIFHALDKLIVCVLQLSLPRDFQFYCLVQTKTK